MTLANTPYALGDLVCASERLLSKVERRGPDDCWPWKAGTSDKGYGRFRIMGYARNAHRLAWELANQTLAAADQVVGTGTTIRFRV